MASDRSRRVVSMLPGVVVAFVAGVAVGVLGTFKHRYGVDLTGSGFPTGLLLCLALVAVVLAALRVSFDTRVYAVAAAAGMVVAVGVFSMKGPGGSVVVVPDSPGDHIGLLWQIGVLVLAVVASGVPRFRRRAPDGELGQGHARSIEPESSGRMVASPAVEAGGDEPA